MKKVICGQERSRRQRSRQVDKFRQNILKEVQIMRMIKDTEDLIRKKNELTYWLEMFTITMLILGSDLSLLFSTWGTERRIRIFLITTPVAVLFLSVLYLVHRYVKNESWLQKFYFGVANALLLLIVVMTFDRSIVSLSCFMLPIIMMNYSNYHTGYIKITIGLYMAAIAVFAMAMPHFTVELAWGYYIISMVSAVIALVVTVKSIRLFKGYEAGLTDQIMTISEQNAELQNLNQSISAAEEELRQQFQETVALNKQSSKLIERLNAVYNASEDGIVDIDRHLDRIITSAQAAHILHENFSDQQDFISTIEKHMKDDQFGRFREIWHALIQFDHQINFIEIDYMVEAEVKILRMNLISYRSQQDQSEHIIVVVKDITEESRQAQRIYRMAYEDQLTGMMNRIAFIEAVEQFVLQNNGKECLVYIVDIDNFKYINDTFGFNFGDQIIKAAAYRLTAEKDCAVHAMARIGGDEFAFLCDGSFPGDRFTTWIQAILSHFEVEDIEIKLNCSIGSARTTCGDDQSHVILKNAEFAMYKAKERGKRGYFEYSELLYDEIKNRLIMTSELETALDNSELSLNYQPKVDSFSLKVVGFEALIRWHSMKLGWVNPLDFITLAEQTGMIHEIGEFVIREACQFAKKINKMAQQEIPLRVSVNVSSVQLLNKDFFDKFMNVLDEVQVPSDYIGIEITETAVMENRDYVCGVLDKFRTFGIHIYLDDFGTGYSSLNYLTQLPIDILKIDKTFVDHIQNEKREFEVVQMIISLATMFDMETVAEGVESEDQLELLRKMGCHMIQGYYYSKPLAEVEALSLLE